MALENKSNNETNIQEAISPGVGSFGGGNTSSFLGGIVEARLAILYGLLSISFGGLDMYAGMVVFFMNSSFTWQSLRILLNCEAYPAKMAAWLGDSGLGGSGGNFTTSHSCLILFSWDWNWARMLICASSSCFSFSTNPAWTLESLLRLSLLNAVAVFSVVSVSVEERVAEDPAMAGTAA